MNTLRLRVVDSAVVLFVLSAACSAARTDSTVENCEHYEEAVFQRQTEAPTLDWQPDSIPPFRLLFVIEPKLRPHVEDIVYGVVKSLAYARYPRSPDGTSQAIDFSARFRIASTFVDVAGLTELLPSLTCADSDTSCTQVSLPSVEYFGEPYGYGTTDDAFAAAVHCALSMDGDTCQQSVLPTSEQFPASNCSTNVVWITDQDVCTTDADGCDEFRQLTELADGSHELTMSVVAAVPPELLANDSTTYAQLLASPGLPAAGQSVACGRRSNSAHAPRNLIAQFQRIESVASLCDPDPGPAIALGIQLQYECCGSTDLDCGGAFARLTPDADGIVPCTWTETLPISGAITHCAQLGAYGRALLTADDNTGAETCRMQQLAFVDGTIQGQQGYAYARMSDAEATMLGFKAWCFDVTEEAPRFWVPRDFSSIPGSSMHMVCTALDETACR
jgi:hypothetical protein